MFWTTQSAGWIGSFVIVVFACVGFALTARTAAGKVRTFLKSLAVMLVVLSAFAKINEALIKPTFHIARPSHAFIIRQAESTAKLDSIYSLVTQKRRAFFKDLIARDTLHFKTFDQRILDHWVEEAGYSLPSGHSFNAFLLGSILSFAIYELSGRRRTVWAYIPLVWASLVAISRVAVGAHTALDVTVGSGLGLVISHLLIALPLTQKLILPADRQIKDTDQK